jgi:hypothetical protein
MRELLTFQERRNLLIAAWVIAALATVLVEIALLLAFPMFPLGLFIAMETRGLAVGGPLSSIGAACAVGWVVYLAISLAALFTKRWLLFILFYGILGALLVFNVQGCHHMMKTGF